MGDRLLVLGQMSAVGTAGGAELSSEVGWLVEPRGEKFQRGWAYTSHAEAEREAQEAAR